MYIEAEYIFNQFTTNFIKKQTSPIIIYGTGLNTQRLLERVQDDKIIGLMDEKKTGQVLWGYKVLSYEEVAAIKGAIIVVIARNAVINVIYRRIEKFCYKHGIRVYDIHGKELGEKSDVEKSFPCFQLEEDKLQTAIQKHDIISFDIIDTLLMRKIMCSRDIFSIMDQELINETFCFSKERIKAEDSFEKEYQPNIYEIYERLAWNTGIDKEKTEQLINLEIETEKRFLTKRIKMCEIYEWAIQKGKKVYLVSDMYFSEKIVIDILKSFDIHGYEGIFISCDYRKSKQEGLLKLYRETIENVKSNRDIKYLHIGSDIAAAKYTGVDSYQIYSARKMFESSVYSKSLQYCKTIEENIILATFIEKAFNNPFQNCEKNGKVILNKTEDVIGLFIAPIIYKYVVWLMREVRKENCDFLLFPSRDGYLIKKIYNMVKEANPALGMPEDIYLYTSRRAAMIVAVENEEDVREINEFIFVQGKTELLKERYGISVEKDQIISNTFLVEKCQKEQEAYKSYLEQTGIMKHKKIAFMDFVAMGTVQAALEKVLGKKLVGFYFLRRLAEKNEKRQLECHSLYQPAGDFQIDANIYRFYYLLETIITSYEPTFWGIDVQGKKLFYEEKRDEHVILLLKRIHEEILRYSKEMLCLLPDINKMNSAVDLYDELLGYFSADYSVLEMDELNDLVNIDEFMGKVVADLNR